MRCRYWHCRRRLVLPVGADDIRYVTREWVTMLMLNRRPLYNAETGVGDPNNPWPLIPRDVITLIAIRVYSTGLPRTHTLPTIPYLDYSNILGNRCAEHEDPRVLPPPFHGAERAMDLAVLYVRIAPAHVATRTEYSQWSAPIVRDDRLYVAAVAYKIMVAVYATIQKWTDTEPIPELPNRVTIADDEKDACGHTLWPGTMRTCFQPDIHVFRAKAILFDAKYLEPHIESTPLQQRSANGRVFGEDFMATARRNGHLCVETIHELLTTGDDL